MALSVRLLSFSTLGVNRYGVEHVGDFAVGFTVGCVAKSEVRSMYVT